MAETFVTQEVRLRRRNWALFGWSVLAALVGVAVFSYGAASRVPWLGGVGGVLALGGILGALFTGLVRLAPTEKLGALSVGDHGVDFEGKRLVDHAAIKQGLLLPYASRAGLPVVEIATKHGRAIELVVANQDQGHRVLEALGLDPANASVEARVLWRHTVAASFGSLGFGIALAVVIGFATHNPAAGLVFGRFVAPLMAALPYLFLRAKLRVGADGLFIDEPGRHRFYSYRDVVSVIATLPTRDINRRNAAVEVALKSGETLRFPIPARSGVSRAEAIAQRAREAMEIFAHDDALGPEGVLFRAGRPVAAWIQSLRSAGAGANVNARTAPVAHARLWRTVEDAGTQPIARAAAAVALGPALDEAGRERLRAISEASALPKLRIALSAAASPGRDEEMARALEELDEAEEAERAVARS